jgi:hypothetical protein
MENEEIKEECPICYDNINLIYETTCKHRFCYLCLKRSFLSDNKECPLCREPLPDDLCERASSKYEFDIPDICWSYSGFKDGVWYYDISSTEIIEEAYQKYLIDNKKYRFNISILGRQYIINFDNMTQKSDKKVVRNIFRIDRNQDNSEHELKGMAGLKIDDN